MLSRRGLRTQAPSGRVPRRVTLFDAHERLSRRFGLPMVRDIAEGYIIASELTFKKFQAGDFQQFGFEADKLLREVRGDRRARRRRRGHAEAAAQDAAAPAGDDDRQQRARAAALTSGAPALPAGPRDRPGRALLPRRDRPDDVAAGRAPRRRALGRRGRQAQRADPPVGLRQTLRDPLNLYQLNFFHPARYVLAFSENLYGVAVFGFPLLAAGASALAQLQRPAPARDVSVRAVGLGAGAIRHRRSARLRAGGARVRLPAVALRRSCRTSSSSGARSCACSLLFLLRYLDRASGATPSSSACCSPGTRSPTSTTACSPAFCVGVTLLAVESIQRRPDSGPPHSRGLPRGGPGARLRVRSLR